MEILNINRLSGPNTGTLRLSATECDLIDYAIYQMTKHTPGVSDPTKTTEYKTLYKKFKVFAHLVQHGWVHTDDIT